MKAVSKTTMSSPITATKASASLKRCFDLLDPPVASRAPGVILLPISLSSSATCCFSMMQTVKATGEDALI